MRDIWDRNVTSDRDMWYADAHAEDGTVDHPGIRGRDGRGVTSGPDSGTTGKPAEHTVGFGTPPGLKRGRTTVSATYVDEMKSPAQLIRESEAIVITTVTDRYQTSPVRR